LDIRAAILRKRGNPVEQIKEPKKEGSHHEPSASLATEKILLGDSKFTSILRAEELG